MINNNWVFGNQARIVNLLNKVDTKISFKKAQICFAKYKSLDGPKYGWIVMRPRQTKPTLKK